MYFTYCKIFPLQGQLNQERIVRNCKLEKAKLVREGFDVELKYYPAKTRRKKVTYIRLETRLSPLLQPSTLFLLEEKGFKLANIN